MREFRTKAIVNASARVVFDALTASENYARFDKNCRGVHGKIEAGGKISILGSERDRDRTFTISEIRPYDLMIWYRTLPLGLLVCKRTFTVIAKDDFTSEFHMVEEISGIFATVFPGLVRNLEDEFKIFSAELKRYIESRP